MNVFVDSTVQIIRGKYAWCYGSLISINEDVALVEIDEETTITCDIEDLEMIN